ncbi:hypothetical protein CYLTODRAFT_419644 [Cylindrobasidium torrendii FP15055 ss-10]|uniref:Uncharacterized protein n=1 Tax=Cylindrobasidium torrendii FP15055 ss-10 TaxID=1314674 RepID=A0A0D7BJX8_9AGAR|nr:hypothetical protein CYLTODRAFT_419644 [Cylindrobasidium torrendii FP15055 ss-10]
MASLTDFISLIITLVVIAGLAYGGLRIWQSLSESIETTKANLKDKGYNVSSKGVAVKKNKQIVDRESYLDATQRGFISMMSAASIGKPSATVPEPGNSNADDDSKKRFGRFRRKD